MSIVYRPANAQDLATAEAMVVATINDLTVRHGFGPMAAPGSTNFQLFSLDDDPDGLWIAEEHDGILGFAWSWVCSDLWFLAQLFVDPAQQGRGIGNELLNLTLEHARKSEATHRALITFTFNRVSQGLYMRNGLFPKMPIYFFDAARKGINEKLPEPVLRSIPIDASARTMAILSDIDSGAIGASRTKHHRYLLNDPATTGFLLCAGSDVVGYSYVGSGGHIGPVAVRQADAMGDAFMAALKIAADGSTEKISAFLPGTCENALCLALEYGMHITFPMLLMASPGYGTWTQYLPRNPGYM